MKSTGRNELCHCGSGKKYKNCHLHKTINELAEEIPFDHTVKNSIHKTFFIINDHFKQNELAGACHLLSSMMYILLNEQGISSKLCIGEVLSPRGPFDHSWVEIDERVFDIAIQFTLDETRQSPVYASYEIINLTPSRHEYRYQSGLGLDPIAKAILGQSITEYMDGAPDPYSWDTIAQLGKELGLLLHPHKLQSRYLEAQRVLVSS